MQSGTRDDGRFTGIGQLKCDGTCAETKFRLSAKRTSPFKSAWGRQFSRLLAADLCASAVVILDTPCSEVVWRVLATHSIRQFPFHFPSRASPCAITFQLEFTETLVWQIDEGTDWDKMFDTWLMGIVGFYGFVKCIYSRLPDLYTLLAAVIY